MCDFFHYAWSGMTNARHAKKITKITSNSFGLQFLCELFTISPQIGYIQPL